MPQENGVEVVLARRLAEREEVAREIEVRETHKTLAVASHRLRSRYITSHVICSIIINSISSSSQTSLPAELNSNSAIRRLMPGNQTRCNIYCIALQHTTEQH